MNNRSIFREESIKNKKNKIISNVLVSKPITFTILIYIFFIFSIFILLFIFFGSYTKRTTAYGELIYEKGMYKIYSPQNGIVIKKNINDGDKILKNKELFVISKEKNFGDGRFIDSLYKQNKIRENIFKLEIEENKKINSHDVRSLENEIQYIDQDLKKIDDLISNQNTKIELYKGIKSRYFHIMKYNAASQEEYEIKNMDYLNSITILDNLKRDRINLNKTKNEKIIAIKRLNEDLIKNQLQLERQISINNQDINQIISNENQIVTSMTDGIVTNINTEIGQLISTDKPLATLVPYNSNLIAQLYVPNKAIGFIKVNDNVVIRYKSFPYQKFGYGKGKVISISKSSLSKQELSNVGNTVIDELSNLETIYLVKVKLDLQYINSDKNKISLTSGMLVEADILQEERKLYEWILEPLSSLSGKV